MEVNLTWDLFILVFLLIIIAYSVMIGKDQTIKVILSSYIAILASDGIGNLVTQVIEKSSTLAKILSEGATDKIQILVKIACFVLLTVLLTTRGAFDIVIAEGKNGFVRVIMTGIYGILSAGLLLSTILVILSGNSVMASGNFLGINPVETIAEGSRFISVLVQNYALFFSLPALVFVISSLFGNEE